MSNGETITPDLIREPVVLAVDVGTSSARVGLFDSNGRAVETAFCQQGYQLDTGLDGRATLDPDRLCTIIESLMSRSLQTVEGTSIAAIGISTFWHSLMGVDDTGKPTTDVLSWADTRAGIAVDDLKKLLDSEQNRQRTGAAIHSSYPLAKLHWLRSHYPEIWKQTTRWMSFGEYLVERLTGTGACSLSMASGTGLMDRREESWNTELLDLLHLDQKQLNPISDVPLRPASHIVERFGSQIRDALIFPAIGDGACSNLGSGAIGPDRVALMVGTTGAMRVVTSEAPTHIPSGLWHYRVDERRHLIGGALSEGGNIIDWMRSNLKVGDIDDIMDQVEQLGPDQHGLTWLPFLAGERSPGWRSNVTATLHGIRLDTTVTDIVRSALEAVSLRFATIARRLGEFVSDDYIIVGSGNGLALNPVWVQIMSDVMNRKILMPEDAEASLLGVALLTRERINNGRIEDAVDWLMDGAQTREPDAEHFETYQSALQRQFDLNHRIWDQPYRPHD